MSTNIPRRRQRYAMLFAIGVALVAAVLFYRHFWLEHPISSGPAGPAVPRFQFSDVWTTSPVLLVGLGDSITDGFGASPGHSYFQRLVRNPSDEFSDMQEICLTSVLPNLKAINLSMSGTTSQELIDYQLPRLPIADTETLGLVVMTTGGNDIIHNYGQSPPREGAMYGATFEQAKPWIANFNGRMNHIIDEVLSRFPGGCRIFLANIYDPTDGIGDTSNAGLPAWPDGLRIHSAYNEIISRIASERDEVVLVNIRDEFLGHGIHSRQFWRSFYCEEDPGYWYFDNLEDPNDRGYDAIRRLFLLEMIDQRTHLNPSSEAAIVQTNSSD